MPSGIIAGFCLMLVSLVRLLFTGSTYDAMGVRTRTFDGVGILGGKYGSENGTKFVRV